MLVATHNYGVDGDIDGGGGVGSEDRGPVSVLYSPATALWETNRPHVAGDYSDDFGESP